MRLMVLIEWAVSSALLILAVTALRALLGTRVSAGLRYALWAVVLVRLLVPVQLFPIFAPAVAVPEPGRSVTVTMSPVLNYAPVLDVREPDVEEPLPDDMKPYYNAVRPAHSAPQAEPLPAWQALGWLWLAGSAAMAAAFAVSNAGFARRLRRVRVPLEGADCPLPVYIAQGLPSPCLFGLVRPAVYVTPETADDPVMLRHVLAHEYTHFHHGDHVWNILRSAALCIHWWNPLVWLAVVLSRRDCELACDEGALKRLGDGERIAYGRTLLALITVSPRPQDLLRCATTMTGGQKSVFDRVTRIARAPKRWLWAAVIAVMAAALACVCAFGQAAETESEDGPEPSPSPSLPPIETASPEPAPELTFLDREFICNGKTLTLRDFRKAFTPQPQDISDFTISKFAILDLDLDGTAELVLSVANDTEIGSLILSERDGALYGFVLFHRWFSDLKADGTFYASSGAANWGYETIAFTKSDYTSTPFTWCERIDTGDELYFVDHNPASKQEFWDAVEVQDQKEEPIWYESIEELPYDFDWTHTSDSDRYRAVLLGEQDFLLRYDDGGSRPLNIAGVPDLFDPYSPYTDIDQFAVIDLDGNGTQEVIVHAASVSGDMGGYLLLHQADGQVYGMRFYNPWTFQNLKTDGTYEITDATGSMYGVQSLEIRDEFYLIDDFAWADMSAPSLGEYDTFYVDHKEATREEYEAVMTRQAEKPDAPWWDFTRINIKVLFPY